MCAPALGIELEPHCVGGPGVPDPSLLLHALVASTHVLAVGALLCQGAGSIGGGASPATLWDGYQAATVAMALEGAAGV